MIQLKGKYNTANVMIDELDPETVKQIIDFLNHPAFAKTYIAIMPDCHKGEGAVIGFTMKRNDYVIPNIIGVDIGCTDAETEYLTRDGWKKMNDYTKGTEILQYDKESDTASFVIPSRYIVLPCDKFYHFKNSKGLDQMLSAEHKMLVWKGFKKRNYTMQDFTPIELKDKSLAKGFYNTKTAFTISSSGIDLSDDMIRLDIMISADGCIRRERNNRNVVELHLKKARKIKRAKYILSKCGISYSLTKGKDRATTIYFDVPMNITKDLSKYWSASKDQLTVVADECLYWDGHKGYRSYYSSTDKTNSDIVQFAFSAIGVRAGISVSESNNQNWNKVYVVTPTRNNMVGITQVEETSSTDGKKYCFTVPSGYLVLRRNGKVFITGNCGMLMFKYDKKADHVNLRSFDEFIKKAIPSGFNIHQNRQHIPNMNQPFMESLEETCKRINYDYDRACYSLGTLGGGNHFIEAGADKEGNFCVTIHSGSRNFGKELATFYQSKAKEHVEKNFVTGIQRGLEFLPIENKYAQDYLQSLAVAQEFASRNRLVMMNSISSFLGNPNFECIESVHNFIGSDGIIRKGATPANEGQNVIIPFNMRDGLALCKGKGSDKYNCSAPHGAGRILSRSKAKEKINLDEFRKQMDDAGIYTTSVSSSTLDEAPDVYKDKDLILANITETVDVIEFIKPLYNFKAGEHRDTATGNTAAQD